MEVIYGKGYVYSMQYHIVAEQEYGIIVMEWEYKNTL